MSRSSTTEAIVLRSFRLGEADRVLHLYTAEHGRLGAVAKGVRKTKSRFGGRLEPFSHVELVLHRGRGELRTVTGASLVRAHDRVRTDHYRLRVGSIGAEAMLRLFTEEERNARAFLAATRFLDALDAVDRLASVPALDPIVLSFQLKLLWLSGYLPHIDSCVECGAMADLVAFVPSAGGVVCADCDPGGTPISEDALRAVSTLVRTPIADARSANVAVAAARETLRVVESCYEHHGGFRLRTVTV